MILSDFEQLNTEDFHYKFYESVVSGNYELICDILKHPKLSKRFDVSYNKYHCIIASLINSQSMYDRHMDFLKLFTESKLLKKHANPTLCEMNDVLCGPLGNAIIFAPIETVRFIGKFFNEQPIHNLYNLIMISVLNNRPEGFFYLVEERHLPIENIDNLLSILKNFQNINLLDKNMLNFIYSYKDSQQTSKNRQNNKHNQQKDKQNDTKKHIINTIVKNNFPQKNIFKNSYQLSKKSLSKKTSLSQPVPSIEDFTIVNQSFSNQWKSEFKKNR